MRRFIVLTHQVDPPIQNRITKLLKSNGLSWWHHFPNVWLVVDKQEQWTSSKLRDLIHDLIPATNLFVFKVENQVGWAGWGSEKLFQWIRKTWSGMKDPIEPESQSDTDI
jgi:hypothetical protein